MNPSEWIQPVGIFTYATVLAAVISGRFRARLKLKLIHHKLLAYTALALATMHGILVLFCY